MIFLCALLSFQIQAHIVGFSPWCLANSPVHYECFATEEEPCQKEATRRNKTPGNFDHWECLPYPVDFRKIPKSGEKPVEIKK